jgi:hypothetical protein
MLVPFSTNVGLVVSRLRVLVPSTTRDERLNGLQSRRKFGESVDFKYQ